MIRKPRQGLPGAVVTTDPIDPVEGLLGYMDGRGQKLAGRVSKATTLIRFTPPPGRQERLAAIASGLIDGVTPESVRAGVTGSGVRRDT